MTSNNTICSRALASLKRISVCLIVTTILLCQNVSTASAQSTVELRNAVYRMNTWLSGSEHATGWRKFLHLNLLDAQAAIGDQADVATLQKIQQRFDSDVDGLDKLEFQDVRAALEKQIAALDRIHNRDLAWLAQQAQSQYATITIEQLEQARDEAVYELGLLKQYYRNTMSSRKRAGLFYDLQLNDQIKFLGSLEFELPPEISVGKLTSQINDEREQLKVVEEAIDALPTSDEDDAEATDGPQPDDDSLLLPPRPDNGDSTLKELEEKRDRIEDRVDHLKEMRLELAKLGRPRTEARKSVLRQLAKFNSAFEDVAKSRFDPYFLSVALAAERFNFLYFYGTDDNLQEDYLERVQSLQKILAVDSGESETDSRQQHAELGKLIQWFESANQLPVLVSAVRARFSNPNAYLSVSSNMINQIAGQDVSQRQRIKQTIFGRIIHGVANTNGSVQVQLNPDPNQANVTIQLLGTITSQTYTRERKFRIDVSATGNYSGRRNVFANMGGFYADLADVNACVYSCYGGINSNIGLVQKLAAKSFAKGKPRSDSESSRRTKAQVLEMFEAKTDEALAAGEERFAEFQRKMIDKQSLIPAAYLRTHADRLEIVATKQNQGSLAAGTNAVNHGINRDLQAKIHETFLSNFTDSIFAGKTFSNVELRDEAVKRFNIQPKTESPKTDTEADSEDDSEDEEDASEAEEGDQEFSITFSRVRPIQFEFDNNRMAVTVTGVRFKQGDRAIRAGLKVRVQFRIENNNGQLEIRRDGLVEIQYLDPDKKDAKLVAFRALIEKKLNKGLKADEGFPIPRNLIPVKQLDTPGIAAKLLLSQLRMEDGWAYIGWQYAPHGYSALTQDTPAIHYVPTDAGSWVPNDLSPNDLSESIEIFQPNTLLEGELQINSESLQ